MVCIMFDLRSITQFTNITASLIIGQVLNQRDSELLISYLTVPYMRLPLILTFFASEDRIHKLQSEELRLILDSVMFEPGKCLKVEMTGVAPMMVPTPFTDLLATSYGLLMNELCRSPETVIRSILNLMIGGLACDTGSVADIGSPGFNTSTVIILYLSRLGSRVDNYLSFLIDYYTGKHDCIGLDRILREAEVNDESLQKLIEGRKSLRKFIDGQYNLLFEDYLKKLDNEISKDPTNEKLIDRNSRLACDLHSHKLIFYRNYRNNDINASIAVTLFGSFVYLTTRHTWNKSVDESLRLGVPETELYELLQVTRRRLIHWTAERKQGHLDRIMQTSLQIASSLTGLFRDNETLNYNNRWSRIIGPRSVGRWAVGSTRTAASIRFEDCDESDLIVGGGGGGGIGGSKEGVALSEGDDNDNELLSIPLTRPMLQKQSSFTSYVGEVPDNGHLGVEIDIQMGQMTLRSKHLSALPSEVASNFDVLQIFGDATIQASVLEQAEHRSRYRLVGLEHELEHWKTGHNMCPPLDEEWTREYSTDIAESEKWIIPVSLYLSIYVLASISILLIFYYLLYSCLKFGAYLVISILLVHTQRCNS